MAIKTIDAFAKNLKVMEQVSDIAFIAELVDFAVDRALKKDYNPLDALVSVAYRTPFKAVIGKTLRAAGIFQNGKITDKEKPLTWKGLKVDKQLRAKKGLQDDFIASLTAVTADSVVEQYEEYEAEKQAEKAEKKEELKQKQQTLEHWEQKAERLQKEAAKHGFTIEVKVTKTKEIRAREQKKA